MQVLKLDSKCEDARQELNVVRTNQLVVSRGFCLYCTLLHVVPSVCFTIVFLQCSDTIGWVTGKASGL